VRLDVHRVLALRAALAAAPLGAAQTLATVAALLPRYGSGDAAVAVGTYVHALSATLEAACAAAPDAFAAHLTSHRAAELDAARAIAVAVLDARNELTSP
jgi:hypothetical protein